MGFQLDSIEDVRQLKEMFRWWKNTGRMFTADDSLESVPNRNEYHHTKEGIVIEEIPAGGAGKLQVYTKPNDIWTLSDEEILDVEWPDGDIGSKIPIGSYIRVVWINGEWRPPPILDPVAPFPAALIERAGDRYSFVQLKPGGSGWTIQPQGRCGDGNAAQFNRQSHNANGGFWPEIVLMWRVTHFLEDPPPPTEPQVPLNDLGFPCAINSQAFTHSWSGCQHK